jgi:putative FmdB family regulatory protein
MPIYEYKCPECGALFEKLCLSSSQGDRVQTCPACGSQKAGRVVSRVGSVRSGGEGGASTCGTAGNSGFS